MKFISVLKMVLLWAGLGLSSVMAAQLKENSAEINQDVNIPTMQVAINPGGSACTGHQQWDSAAGGCSDSAYQQTTARVVSVSPSATTLNVGESTTVIATVRSDNGSLVGAGISVTWSASNGTISSTSGTTNASGQVAVTYTASSAGIATITATAVGGAASASVTVAAAAPTGACLEKLPALSGKSFNPRVNKSWANSEIWLDGKRRFSGTMKVFNVKEVNRNAYGQTDGGGLPAALEKYRSDSNNWVYGTDGGIYYPYDVYVDMGNGDSPSSSPQWMGLCIIKYAP